MLAPLKYFLIVLNILLLVFVLLAFSGDMVYSALGCPYDKVLQIDEREKCGNYMYVYTAIFESNVPLVAFLVWPIVLLIWAGTVFTRAPKIKQVSSKPEKVRGVLESFLAVLFVLFGLYLLYLVGQLIESLFRL